jgi:putative transposase
MTKTAMTTSAMISKRRHGPQPPKVELSEPERQELEGLLRRHSTPQQLALRARIVLSAAAGCNHSEVARQLGVSLDTARLWRQRYRSLQGLGELSVEERLQDAPRPGRKARISAEQLCRIMALACEAPKESQRPISQWSGSELAAEVIKRGIVSDISARHASRLLKKGLSNRT